MGDNINMTCFLKEKVKKTAPKVGGSAPGEGEVLPMTVKRL